MEVKQLNTYALLLLLAGTSVLAFFLFKPFLVAIIFALILAELFSGVFRFFLKTTRGKKAISSLFTIGIIALIIVVPFLVVASLLVDEAAGLVESFGAREITSGEIINAAERLLMRVPLMETVDLKSALQESEIAGSLQSVGKAVLGFAQGAYRGISHFVLMTAITFFTLFYLLIDRERLGKKIMYLLPLRDEQEKFLFAKFVSIARATLKGTVVIGVIQGALGGLLFWLVGIPSPLTWGVVMAVFSVIPAIGPGLVWFPAAVIMLLLGNVWQGVVILVFGFAVVSSVDNVLRPKLVGRDTALHPLMIFFSTLGGLVLFGISGFVLGPIIVALFVALWEMYGKEFHGQLEKYNK